MSKLESALEELAKDDEIAEELYHQYSTTYSYLQDEYYKWIQSNPDCSYFSDHGESHIQTVIHQAGELLNDELKKPENGSLSCVDIYVLLSSIIWHDVGMVEERAGHENFPSEIADEIQRTLFPNSGIQSVVSRISRGHTGDTGLSIPSSKKAVTMGHKTYHLHPKALAAILRFADEISENENRVSSADAVIDQVPEDARIYWEFAKSITAIAVDLERERITVNIELEWDQAIQTYICPDDYQQRANDGEITLIEYIVCRLEKMNNEKIYCAPEFYKYAYIREIEARFAIDKGKNEGGEKEEIQITQVLGEGGVKQNDYPEVNIYDDFFDENEDLQPDTHSLES